MAEERRPDFDEWFFALYPDALALASRIVGDWAEGEDVAAEAFTRALARWDRLRTLGYRDAWLLRVTVNIGIDALRHRRVDVGVDAGVAQPDEVERRIVVVAALRKLSRRQSKPLPCATSASSAKEKRPRSWDCRLARSRRTFGVGSPV